MEQFEINGVAVAAPSTYSPIFATTSTEDSDRSQDGVMHNTPMFTIGYLISVLAEAACCFTIPIRESRVNGRMVNFTVPILIWMHKPLKKGLKFGKGYKSISGV